MRATTGFILALTIGALSGLGLTWWSLARGPGFGAIEVGAWRAFPQTGTQEADRYAKASIARSGELPLGSGEGLAFIARHDDAGAALSGRCRYRIEPIVPSARWWTLTLYDGQGQLFANPESRYGFTSGEVIRDGRGAVTIVTAADPQGGNWLPSPEAPFTLVLRLYDTPISTGLATEETVSLPRIAAEGCA